MRRLAGFVLAVVVVAGAATFAWVDRWPWQRLAPPPAAVLPVEPRTWVAPDTLHPGESLGDLFGRHGLGAPDLVRLVDLFQLDPRRLRAGLVFQFGHAESDSMPTAVTLRTRSDEEIQVLRLAANWTAERRAIRWAARPIRVEGTIESSLSEALETATASEPLSDEERIRLAWDLADVFAWEVDFTRDLQPDDEFRVVLEREVSERGETRIGRVLAGELSVAKRRFTAFRFDSVGGRPQFFDEHGESLRRAFLRAPVQFRRIASQFSRSRFHPILGIWRAHEGLDYSAAAGTPVLAAADGTVTVAGWSGGYGRLVEVRHRNGIATRYGHLRAFARGIHPGSRVRQGEVVGFVGATGLATAPHLHYEFRERGVARDPARVDLGNGEPVPASAARSFAEERRRLESLLRPAPTSPSVAGSE
jgi:murein DD-endopeptidase MepM/ murein hydrolase activator NlpD